MAMPIIPAKVKTRNNPLRNEAFEYLCALLIIGVSSASQSMTCAIEEILQLDPRMSLFVIWYENE
jgi:hypothetical protein